MRPPDRAGISFVVGAPLEARDKHNRWCSGTIKQLDPETGRVLVQYRRWSKRVQDWFNWDSPQIRGLDRVTLRRTGLNQTTEPLYRAGCKVMACWTDCKFYPAKVLRVNHKDESYTVRFYDGVIRTIRPTKIKPYDQKWKEENSSEDWDEDSDSEKDTREGHKDVLEETGHTELGDKEGTKKGEVQEEGVKADIERKQDLGAKETTEERKEGDKEVGGKVLGDIKPEVKKEGKTGSVKADIKEEQDVGTKETTEERKEVGCKETGHKEIGHKDVGLKKDVEERRKRRIERLREVPPKRKRINNRKHQPITEKYSSPGSTHMDRDVLLERQAHLPTTNKYSREPLYRVIKRQPPPILSIDLDHNQFKCPAPDCGKSFRKSSLLHCHLKYYHSTAPSATSTTHNTVERKKGESKPELSTCCRGDQEAVSMETGGPDCVAGDTGPSPGPGPRKDSDLRRDRKHFLRVKLKKKKKKKKKRKRRSLTGFCSSDDENMSQPPVSISLNSIKHEEGSDWSTLTAESGEDTPSWHVAVETDVVRCVCEVTAVSDYMLQCTRCWSWQHGSCVGLIQVPQNYTCFTCRPHLCAPDGTCRPHLCAPDSTCRPHLCAPDGTCRPNLSAPDGTCRPHLCAPDGTCRSHLCAPDGTCRSHLSDAPRGHCCRPAPDWSRGPSLLPPDWSRESVPRRRLCCDWSRCRRTLVSDWLRSGHMFGLSCVNRNFSEEHSEQISLTHALLGQVQTVGALSAGLRLKLRLLQSRSEATLRFWRLPWRREEGERPKVVCYVNSEHCYTTPAQVQVSPEEVQTHSDSDSVSARVRVSGSGLSPELNLLDHIESLQHEICKRLERMETGLDGLESWLDELESPDPLSRLPELKQRIKRLLRDLSLVRQLSISV